MAEADLRSASPRVVQKLDRLVVRSKDRVAQHREQSTNAAISLLKRLPPQHLGKNIDRLTEILPHLGRSLAPYISKPLQLKLDPDVNKYFIACDFNFHEGFHRSPWTDSYFPDPGCPNVDTEKNASLFRPNTRLRHLEVQFNEVFDAYKTCHYEGGVSSVYLWDLNEGFAAVFLLRKELSETKGVRHGVWDVIHVAEVKEALQTSIIEYKVTTTVLVHLESGGASSNHHAELGALVTKQREDKKKRPRDNPEDMHIINIGRLIEESEAAVQHQLDNIFLAKSVEVLHTVRALDPHEQELLMPDEEADAQRQGRRAKTTMGRMGGVAVAGVSTEPATEQPTRAAAA